jgi:abhydrolase domain-containing protein 13
VPFEEHYIACPDGVSIHAWLLKYRDDSPTILFFHGNAGNIGLRLPNALQMMRNLQANIMMVEYRGYGNSDVVTPTEEGLKLDALAALEFATRLLPKSSMYAFGSSLGGAVAIDLAMKRPNQLAGVIVENTFTSISDMVDCLMPWLTPIKPFVLKIGWNSKQVLTDTRFKMPFLFLAGAKDELVPHSHMLDLYRLAPVGSILHIIPNGTHNESWLRGGVEYWDAWRRFLAMEATTSGGSISASFDQGSGIPITPSSFTGMEQAAAGHGASKTFKKEL